MVVPRQPRKPRGALRTCSSERLIRGEIVEWGLRAEVHGQFRALGHEAARRPRSPIRRHAQRLGRTYRGVKVQENSRCDTLERGLADVSLWDGVSVTLTDALASVMFGPVSFRKRMR